MIWRGRHSKLTILTHGTSAFYLNAHLRSLMFAMVRIFVPVFLYKTGVSLWQTAIAGFLVVAGYYVLVRLTVIIMAIPISKIIERIGFRRSVSLSVLLLIVEMAGMAGAADRPELIILAAVLSGINIPMYWIARDSALSQDVEQKGMGKTMAVISSLEQIAAMTGPFIAGSIVVAWGFPALFITAVGLLVLSAIPLWWMPPHTHKNGVSLRGFGQWLKDKRYSHQALGIAGACAQDFGLVVFWPLAIFLMGVELSTLGSIYSVVAVVALGVKVIVGRVFDKLRARRDWADEVVYGVAAVGSALSWPVRMLLTTVGSIFAVNAVAEIFHAVYYNFHCNYAHLGGKRMGSIAFWVYAEIVYSTMAVMMMGVLMAGVYWGVWRELTFITISIWVLASSVMGKESNLK